MSPARQAYCPVDIIVINWTVYSFVGMVLVAIALAFCKVAYPQGVIIAGLAAVILHGLVIFRVSRSLKPQTTSIPHNARGIKLLEYTLSSVCWVLNAMLWWYHAQEAGFVVLFVPTYFATSLTIYHVCFNYLAGCKNNKKTLLVLALNLFTVAHYMLIYLKILKP